jgi:hypothetical protein
MIHYGEAAMTKIKEKREEAYEDITYAESGVYKPDHKKREERDSLEDIFTAIGMAEGGDGEYAKKLHPLFHRRHRSN